MIPRNEPRFVDPIVIDNQPFSLTEDMARRTAISDQCLMLENILTMIAWEGTDVKINPTSSEDTTTIGDLFILEYYRLQALVEKFIKDNGLPVPSDEEIEIIKSSKIESLERIIKKNKEKGLIYDTASKE